jgi:hypothetical protein
MNVVSFNSVCLITAHSWGKYTETSNPPLNSTAGLLNRFSGRRIYWRNSTIYVTLDGNELEKP